MKTPREEFQEQFGQITDDQWEWLKQFCLKNPVTGNTDLKATDIDYNEYAIRDENGDEWLIGGPKGAVRKEKTEQDTPKPDVVDAYQAGIRAEQDRRRTYWNENLSDYTEEQWRTANPGYPKQKEE